MIRQLFFHVKRFSGVNWAFFDQALVSGINFLMGLFLARQLGLSGYGVFTLTWTAVLFFNGIQQAFVIAPMMSIGPKQPSSAIQSYFGGVVLQQFMFAVCSSLLVFAMASLGHLVFPGWQAMALALPLTAVTFFYQMHDFVRRYCFTRYMPAQAFAVDCVGYLGQALLITGLLLTQHLTASNVYWMMSLALGLGSALGLKSITRLHYSSSSFWSVLERHWNTAKWLVASALLQWGSSNIFIIVASSLLGTWAAGAIKSMQNIVGILHVFFLALENYLPVQAATRYHSQGIPGMLEYLRAVTLAGGILTLAFAALVFVLASPLIELLYGSEFLGYDFVLRGFALLYVLVFFSLPLRIALRTLEQTRPIFFAYMLSALFSLLASVVLVDRLGIIGVLAGLFIAQVITQACCLLGLQQTIRLRST